MRTYARTMKQRNPSTSRYVFINFEPPAKDSLPNICLSAAELRNNGMALRSTHCYSSEWSKWSPIVRRHPLPNSPPSGSLRPALLTKDDEDDTWGLPSEPWKRYYRLNKPEQIKISTGSILKTWRLDKKILLQRNQTLAGRRSSLKDRRHGFRRASANKRKLALERRKTEKKSAKKKAQQKSGVSGSSSSSWSSGWFGSSSSSSS